MTPWQIWLVVALVLFILEIFTPGFFVACFGVAALAASLAALTGAGFLVQLAGFAAALLLVFIGLRPVVMKHLSRRSAAAGRTNVDALIGKTAVVLQPVDTLGHQGRIQVGGEDWKSRSAEPGTIDENEIVIIDSVDGNTLVVRRPRAAEGGQP